MTAMRLINTIIPHFIKAFPTLPIYSEIGFIIHLTNQKPDRIQWIGTKTFLIDKDLSDEGENDINDLPLVPSSKKIFLKSINKSA